MYLTVQLYVTETQASDLSKLDETYYQLTWQMVNFFKIVNIVHGLENEEVVLKRIWW